MKLWDRFHLAVTVLALWATLALFTTGEFPAAVVGPCVALLPLGYLFRRAWRSVPMWVWDLSTLVVFVALLPVARLSLLSAAVYFFLALQLVKVFSFRRLSDAFSVYLISFFEILAAAVLTTSLAFGFIFLGYVILLVRSLMFQMSLQALLRAARFENRWSATQLLKKPSTSDLILLANCESARGFVVPSLAVPSLILTVLVLVLSVGFFLVVPRLSTRRIVQSLAPATSAQPQSAFDEGIEFGKVGSIQLNNTVALYVKPLDEGPRPPAIRLRGVALDKFDGRRWQRTTGPSRRTWLRLKPFSLRPLPQRRSLVIQLANTSRFLFGETFPFEFRKFDFEQALVVDVLAGAAWLSLPPNKELHYQVVSNVETLEDRRPPEQFARPSASRLRGPRASGVQPASAPARHGSTDAVARALRDIARQFGGGPLVEQGLASPDRSAHVLASGAVAYDDMPPDDLYPPYREACLQLPDNMDVAAIRSLAHQITDQAPTSYSKALAIESYLRRQFQYSLQIVPPSGQGFIEDFLFRTRRGHCEYFASAMVMLLRSLGIPSRVVNGYYSAEWNQIAGMFVVRQRDAHTWVEVHFDGYGWMTFDPTPPEAIGRQVEMNWLLLAASRYFEALKLRWYRAVIDFSLEDQRLIVSGFLGTILRAGEYLSNLGEGEGSVRLSEEGPRLGETLAAVASVALVVLALAAAWARLRPIRQRQAMQRTVPSVSRPLPRFYAQLLEALRTRGFVRKHNETPLEFAQRVARHEALKPFEAITRTYYAWRYGHRVLRPEEHRAIEDFHRSLVARRRHNTEG